MLNRSNDKRRTEHKGKAILLTLGPTLQERGVLPSRYMVVDVDSGEFVTGQIAAEAAARFKVMHRDPVAGFSGLTNDRREH